MRAAPRRAFSNVLLCHRLGPRSGESYRSMIAKMTSQNPIVNEPKTVKTRNLQRKSVVSVRSASHGDKTLGVIPNRKLTKEAIDEIRKSHVQGFVRKGFCERISILKMLSTTPKTPIKIPK